MYTAELWTLVPQQGPHHPRKAQVQILGWISVCWRSAWSVTGRQNLSWGRIRLRCWATLKAKEPMSASTPIAQLSARSLSPDTVVMIQSAQHHPLEVYILITGGEKQLCWAFQWPKSEFFFFSKGAAGQRLFLLYLAAISWFSSLTFKELWTTVV